MTNTFAPFGFLSFGQREGTSPTAGMEVGYILSSDTNNYFTGDLVALTSDSLVAGFLNLPTSGSKIYGVFNGCEYYNSNVGRVVWSSYFPASAGSSSPAKAFVITNPQQMFIVQGTTTAVLGTSCIGLNINEASSLQASGNTTTGRSYLALNSSTVTASASMHFRIVDTYQRYAPPGANGTSSGSEAAQIMVVQPNNWARNNLTGVTT